MSADSDEYWDEQKVMEKFLRQFPAVNVYWKFQYRMDRLLENQ